MLLQSELGGTLRLLGFNSPRVKRLVSPDPRLPAEANSIAMTESDKIGTISLSHCKQTA